MMRYTVKLTDLVPGYCETEVEVEAVSKETAVAEARRLADDDDVDWSDVEHDWDDAKTVDVEVTETVRTLLAPTSEDNDGSQAVIEKQRLARTLAFAIASTIGETGQLNLHTNEYSLADLRRLADTYLKTSDTEEQ